MSNWAIKNRTAITHVDILVDTLVVSLLSLIYLSLTSTQDSGGARPRERERRRLVRLGDLLLDRSRLLSLEWHLYFF